jgi:hypothetical protein
MRSTPAEIFQRKIVASRKRVPLEFRFSLFVAAGRFSQPCWLSTNLFYKKKIIYLFYPLLGRKNKN